MADLSSHRAQVCRVCRQLVETAEDEAATAREVQAMILKADRDWQAERKTLLQRCPPPPTAAAGRARAASLISDSVIV